MSWPNKVERGIHILALVLLVIGMIGLIIMFPVITADVLLRKLFNAPLPFVLELVATLNVTVIFMSAAYLQRRKGHVGVDILVPHMPPKMRDTFELIYYLVGIGMFGVMTWQTGLWGLESLAVRETTQGLIPFPLYPTKLLIPAGTFVMTIVLFVDLVHATKKLFWRSQR